MEREEKFTPGPWSTYVHGEEFECIGVKDKYGQSICECFEASRWEKKGLPGINGDEKEANGYLIAAAPEMYEALKNCAGALTEVLEQIENGEKFDNVASDCLIAELQDEVEKAVAVLKKARGEE